MTRNKLFSVLAIIALAAAIGFGTNAFAGRGGGGWGWCDGPGSGPGAGYGRSGDFGPGYRYDGGNLTEAQAKALDDENRAFFDATDGLRNNLRQKHLELRSEMAKEKVNIETAKKLQKEISALDAQFDEKRIDHIVKLREIDPNGAGRSSGYQGSGPRGRGSMGRGCY
jgi:hypothetical protein